MEKDQQRMELEDGLARYLKAALKQAGVTYEELAERLKGHGFTEETKASIASKLSRGAFSASFLVAALHAIGKKSIALDEIA